MGIASGGIACPKPVKRSTLKRKAKKEKRERTAEIRDYVRGRERGRCRCCRFRAGQSMHEILPRSRGGKVSKKNSIWMCGDGTTGCHGYAQRYELVINGSDEVGAEGALRFSPRSTKAAEWMRITQYSAIESAPMSHYEAD